MKNAEVTVVMYHLIRETEGVPFPLKAITPSQFSRQLRWLRNHYVPVTAKQCREQLKQPTNDFPEKAVLLTFDDGYRDHFDVAMPALLEMGFPAIFFPSVCPVKTGKLLPYNKVQFVLSHTDRIGAITQEILQALDQFRKLHPIPSNEELYQKLAKPFRFDSAEVVFIKRLLQMELPEKIRLELTDALFRKWVTTDEAALAETHYLSVPMTKSLVAAGFEIGVHGWDHPWFTAIEPQEVRRQCRLSLDFLNEIGSGPEWSAAYPYGAHNDSTIGVMKEMKCEMAFTTEPANAQLTPEKAHRLPRWDTNDFPKEF